MPSLIFGLACAGPVTLALVGLIPATLADRHRRMTIALAGAAALVACAAAPAVALMLALSGTPLSCMAGINGVGFGLYLDALSGAMLVLVSFVGAVVVNYSRNYLAGDPRQGRFLSLLCLTLAAVLLLIVSGNLFQFALAWVGTSLGLNSLLLFYRDRQAAVLAARKKFIVSRLGDLCLATAIILIYRAFGTLDFGPVFAGITAMHGRAVPEWAEAAALLMVAAGLLKSAQFPIHGWLLEVMETPTPVSALLHAGIINAGGFLVLRFAGIIALSTPALDLLAIVGGFTALFGSLVMLTQTSIKVALAYSTIAQMGFMMLECGLGAFSIAFLHILAHSLYKAHAFLSSGSVVDIARASWSPGIGGGPHRPRFAIAAGGVLAGAALAAALYGAAGQSLLTGLALDAVVILGLAHLLAQAIDRHPTAAVVARTAARAAVVAGVYFGLRLVSAHLLAGIVPPMAAGEEPLRVGIVVLVVLSFGALTAFQSLLPGPQGAALWAALYAHTANGFYVNTLGNRWILRFWPSPPTATAPSTSDRLSGAPL